MADGPAPELRFDQVSQEPHPLLHLLRPRPGEHILDIGCGQGYWASRFIAAGASVVGVDIDRESLAVAAAAGVETVEADARTLDFSDEFDAAFTNAALHWMPPISDLVRRVHRSLKPGGRFIGEFGGHGNVASIRVAIRHGFAAAGLDFRDYDPWEFPTTPAFCDMLEAAGFEIERIETFPRHTPLPQGLEHWLDYFMSDIYARLPEGKGDFIKGETVRILRDIASQGDEHWVADYVRLRFRAAKT